MHENCYMGMATFETKRAQYFQQLARAFPLEVKSFGSRKKIRPLSLEIVGAQNSLIEERAIIAAQRALLLDGPGSGKSVFVNTAVNRLIEGEAFVPLPFRLRHVDQVIASPADLASVLARQAEAAGIGQEFFLEALGSGRGHTIFDGIDELPMSRKNDQLGAFNALMGQASQAARWLFTGRSEGYFGGIEDSVERFVLHGLTAEGVRKFIHLFYQNLKDQRGVLVYPEPEYANQTALDFISKIPHEGVVARALKNPTLLPMICLFFFYEKQLPENGIIGLYQAAIDQLAADFNAYHKNRYPERPHESNLRKIGRVAAEIFTRLATVFHEKDQISFSVDDVVAALKSGRNQYTNAEELAQDIVEFDLLFTSIGSGRYTFAHLSFQEAFFARHLSQLGDEFAPYILNNISNDRQYNALKLGLGFFYAIRGLDSFERLLRRLINSVGDPNKHKLAFLIAEAHDENEIFPPNAPPPLPEVKQFIRTNFQELLNSQEIAVKIRAQRIFERAQSFLT
jgi:predicted NACHT family NTPase